MLYVVNMSCRLDANNFKSRKQELPKEVADLLKKILVNREFTVVLHLNMKLIVFPKQ